MTSLRFASLVLATTLLLPAIVLAQANSCDDSKLREGLATRIAATDAPVVALAVHADGQTPAAVAALDAAGVPHSDLARVGVSQVLLSGSTFHKLCSEASIAAFYPERVLRLSMEESSRIIHATEAREFLGEDGRNATVLVIDSGADTTNPDLADRIITIAQPHDPMETGLVPAGYTEDVPANDLLGHGTHVTGTVVGTGQALGPQDPNHGRIVGVAPGAGAVVYTVPGLGNADSVFQAVQGFEYALEKQAEYGLRVITNSWGIAGKADLGHPISVASRKAYEAGMVVTFSAGNDGTRLPTNQFGAAPWVIMVASSTKAGKVSDFSSRGTDDEANRPDVIAPGSSILATKSRIGALQATSAADAPFGGGNLLAQATFYQYMSGTSMATPHVAGVLALAASANPTLSPDQLYDILVRTVDEFPNGDLGAAGVGLVNASAAVLAARQEDGRLDDFLKGDRKYGDAARPDKDPVNAFLSGASARPGTVGKPGPGGKANPEGSAAEASTPAAGVFLAVLAVATVGFAVRRRL